MVAGAQAIRVGHTPCGAAEKPHRPIGAGGGSSCGTAHRIREARPQQKPLAVRLATKNEPSAAGISPCINEPGSDLCRCPVSILYFPLHGILRCGNAQGCLPLRKAAHSYAPAPAQSRRSALLPRKSGRRTGGLYRTAACAAPSHTGTPKPLPHSGGYPLCRRVSYSRGRSSSVSFSAASRCPSRRGWIGSGGSQWDPLRNTTCAP